MFCLQKMQVVLPHEICSAVPQTNDEEVAARTNYCLPQIHTASLAAENTSCMVSGKKETIKAKSRLYWLRDYWRHFWLLFSLPLLSINATDNCLGGGMCSMAPCHIHLTPMNVKIRHATEVNAYHTPESFPVGREAGRNRSVSSEDVSQLWSL